MLRRRHKGASASRERLRHALRKGLAKPLADAAEEYGRLRGSSAETSQALMYAVVLFVFGLIMSGVDNWAHLGGFAGGYLAARWLDPWKPERLNHLVGALACLAASALAIIASLVHYAWMMSS